MIRRMPGLLLGRCRRGPLCALDVSAPFCSATQELRVLAVALQSLNPQLLPEIWAEVARRLEKLGKIDSRVLFGAFWGRNVSR